MAHRVTCLIPTCKNTCGRNNTKTFLEIFFIGYHFITALKVSSATSSLNVCEKTFEKSGNTQPIQVTGYTDISLPEQPDRRLTRESRTLPNNPQNTTVRGP